MMNVLMGAAAALVILAVAELAARAWIRSHRRYHVWTPGMRRLLHVSDGISPNLERVVEFSVNADGERGDEVRPGPGLFRVLVAGGSPVESLFLDQNSSWPGQLERQLSTPAALRALRADRVHVGNIGRSTVGAQALDLIFERVLPRYERLDAIVIMIGGADVVHWLSRSAPSPYLVHPVPVKGYFSVHPEGPYLWVPAYSALRELLRRAKHRWMRPVETVKDAGAWMHRACAMRANAVTIRRSVPDPEVMLQQFEHYFRRVLWRAQNRARRVVFVCQPCFDTNVTATASSRFWHGGIGVAWREKVTEYYSLEIANRLMHLLEKRAIDIADDMGIEHLDVRSELRPSLEHYYDWLHYTPEGSAAVARVVSEALLRAPVLKDVASLRDRAVSAR